MRHMKTLSNHLPNLIGAGRPHLKLLIRFAAVALFALLTNAQAQTYPNKPIRLVVPFPAGGPTDILGRAIGAKLSEAMGQPVVIDNRGGAGGGLGADSVAKSAPDGHTILLGTTGTHTINPNLYSKLPYDPIKDFVAISLVVKYINILVVNPNVPAKNVAELIALAKQKPGEITFGSAGNGSSNHLTGEMLATMAGVKMQHVPYKGSGPALNDVIAGQLSFMFDQYSTVAPQVKAGRLRAIGVATPKRHALMPDVPTVAETVPGFEVSAWYGMFVAANTPRDIVNRLNVELSKIMKMPDIHERMTALGWDPITNTPEQFTAQIKAELAIWADVVKKSGARID
jgi:tripartite-type tricarboxylate transporter receptor subunit TctC